MVSLELERDSEPSLAFCLLFLLSPFSTLSQGERETQAHHIIVSLEDNYKDYMIEKPRGARRKGPDSCFRLVSPHQQSIPFPYLQAPQVIKVNSVYLQT